MAHLVGRSLPRLRIGADRDRGRTSAAARGPVGGTRAVEGGWVPRWSRLRQQQVCVALPNCGAIMIPAATRRSGSALPAPSKRPLARQAGRQQQQAYRCWRPRCVSTSGPRPPDQLDEHVLGDLRSCSTSRPRMVQPCSSRFAMQPRPHACSAWSRRRRSRRGIGPKRSRRKTEEQRPGRRLLRRSPTRSSGDAGDHCVKPPHALHGMADRPAAKRAGRSPEPVNPVSHTAPSRALINSGPNHICCPCAG